MIKKPGQHLGIVILVGMMMCLGCTLSEVPECLDGQIKYDSQWKMYGLCAGNHWAQSYDPRYSYAGYGCVYGEMVYNVDDILFGSLMIPRFRVFPCQRYECYGGSTYWALMSSDGCFNSKIPSQTFI